MRLAAKGVIAKSVIATCVIARGVIACGVVVAGVLRAQTAPLVHGLTTPDRVLEADFSQIRGVRELRDGRVLVSDRMENRVVVANFATNAVQLIGRTGRGPAEYRLPTGLYALPGDSTLLVDEGNQRVAIIGPDLRIHRSFTLMVPGVPVAMGTRGADTRGRYYLTIPQWASPAPKPADSIVLVRFDQRSEKVDTVATIKGMTQHPPGPALKPRMPFIPFSPQDVWAMSADGRVGIVRAGDYHVEWHEIDGKVVRGAAVPVQPLPVTVADREAYSRRFLENSSTSGRDPDGGLSPNPASLLTASAVREFTSNNTFAETKPAFVDAAPFIASDGTLWVERYGKLGEPQLWDVFDRAGALIQRVRLAPGRRIAGLGAGTVYVIATDADGLQRLEQHRRPR